MHVTCIQSEGLCLAGNMLRGHVQSIDCLTLRFPPSSGRKLGRVCCLLGDDDRKLFPPCPSFCCHNMEAHLQLEYALSKSVVSLINQKKRLQLLTAD